MRHIYSANRLQTFTEAYTAMKADILAQPFVAVGQWQSQATELKTRELMGAVLEYVVPPLASDLVSEIDGLGMPWAEDHFQERVGGLPLNPPPSEAWWPHNIKKNAAHKTADAKFSHTYPERFWPKLAGDKWPDNLTLEARQRLDLGRQGIRYQLGDLGDVVALMRKEPHTRQAYLPVWFPEDTGVAHGERVPCTLGYHFMIRGGRLHCWYYMRSCDLIRHFPDDVYMAARLMQWMCAEVGDVEPGVLTMSMSSLHTFETDDYSLRMATRLTRGGR